MTAMECLEKMSSGEALTFAYPDGGLIGREYYLTTLNVQEN